MEVHSKVHGRVQDHWQRLYYDEVKAMKLIESKNFFKIYNGGRKTKSGRWTEYRSPLTMGSL